MKAEIGKLVVLEGGVGCGKSTQLGRLRDRFPNWYFYREPGSTDFGEKVRDAVQGMYDYEVHPYAALFGYSAARANLVRGTVIPLIEQGETVLFDRYWYSTYAYQGATGVSKPLIFLLSHIATGGLRPNTVLHYDLLPEDGLRRKAGAEDLDRFDVEGLAFHRAVRSNYHQLRRIYGWRVGWEVIDASRGVEEVFQDSLIVLRRRGVVRAAQVNG